MIWLGYYVNAIIGLLVFTIYIRDIGMANFALYTMIFSCRMLGGEIVEIFVDALSKYLPLAIDRRAAFSVINTVFFCMLLLLLLFFALIWLFHEAIFNNFNVTFLNVKFEALAIIIIALVLTLDALKEFFKLILRSLGREYAAQSLVVLGSVAGFIFFIIMAFNSEGEIRKFNIFIYEIISSGSVLLMYLFFIYNKYDFKINLGFFSFAKVKLFFSQYSTWTFFMLLASYLRDYFPIIILSKFGFLPLAAILTASLNLNKHLRKPPALLGIHLRPLISRIVNRTRDTLTLRNILRPYMNILFLFNSCLILFAAYFLVFAVNFWYPDNAVLARTIFQYHLVAYSLVVYFAFVGGVIPATPYFKVFSIISCVGYMIAFLLGSFFIKQLSIYGFFIFGAIANMVSRWYIFKAFLIITESRYKDYYLKAPVISILFILLQIILYRFVNFKASFIIHSASTALLCSMYIIKIYNEKNSFLAGFRVKEMEYPKKISEIMSKPA